MWFCLLSGCCERAGDKTQSAGQTTTHASICQDSGFPHFDADRHNSSEAAFAPPLNVSSQEPIYTAERGQSGVSGHWSFSSVIMTMGRVVLSSVRELMYRLRSGSAKDDAGKWLRKQTSDQWMTGVNPLLGNWGLALVLGTNTSTRHSAVWAHKMSTSTSPFAKVQSKMMTVNALVIKKFIS